MIPGTHPVVLYRGDDWAMTVIVQTSSQQPISLTGWTYRAQIRKKATDTSIIGQFDVRLDNEQDNKLIVSITHAASTALESNGVWDLELTDETGLVQTVLAGPVTVIQDVTRS